MGIFKFYDYSQLRYKRHLDKAFDTYFISVFIKIVVQLFQMLALGIFELKYDTIVVSFIFSILYWKKAIPF